jgi:hypothetical protein
MAIDTDRALLCLWRSSVEQVQRFG